MNVIKIKAHGILLKYFVELHWNSFLNSHGVCLFCKRHVAGNNSKDRAVTLHWKGREEIDVLVYP